MQAFFAIMLVISIALVMCLHRWANEMAQWAAEVPAQVPAVDPRVLASQASADVAKLTRDLDERMLTLQAVTYRPRVVEQQPNLAGDAANRVVRNTQVSTIVDKDAIDLRVDELLRGRLNWDSINELAGYLQPGRHPLPRSVVVRGDAAYAWIKLRGRWPEPVGTREVSDLMREFGFRSSWLEVLRPDLPEHVAFVNAKLESYELDASEAIDWFSRGASFPVYAPGDHPSLRLAESRLRHAIESGDAGEISAAISDSDRWISSAQGRPIAENLTLGVVSRINHPLLWTRISHNVGNQGKTEEYLVRLLDFARWHKVTVDDSSEGLLGVLSGMPQLPRKFWRSNEAEEDGNSPGERHADIAAQLVSEGRLARWLLLDGPSQDELFRSLLETTPDDALRRDAMVIANGPRSLHLTDGTVLSVLAIRWAGPRDIAALWTRATDTSVPKNIHVEMAPTAEAILATSRVNPQVMDSLARYWLNQAPWTREVQVAWQTVDAAEGAFCESLLAMDPAKPSPSMQAVLETLSTIGGDPSLATLKILSNQMNEKVSNNGGLDRFVRLCESRIRQRMAATPPQVNE